MNSINDKIDEFTITVSEWQKCESCLIIDKDKDRMRVGYKCPVCSKPSSGGVMYFELSVHLTIDLIAEAYTTKQRIVHNGMELEYSTNTHYISVLLFFCTLREILLNGLIRELCWELKLPKGVYDRLLKDNKFHIKGQNELLPSLTGVKWRASLEEINKTSKYDYLELNEKINVLSDLRNKFAHKGHCFLIDERVANDCVNSIDPLINLYVDLHNLYVHPVHLNK